ncbi:hypothetical protein C8R44DRAFT_736530 [Mycena epipterygia]|nr:hypothetical protein C8R44DRAFT_736530 [Mycena epipterygia]
MCDGRAGGDTARGSWTFGEHSIDARMSIRSLCTVWRRRRKYILTRREERVRQGEKGKKEAGKGERGKGREVGMHRTSNPNLPKFSFVTRLGQEAKWGQGDVLHLRTRRIRVCMRGTDSFDTTSAKKKCKRSHIRLTTMLGWAGESREKIKGSDGVDRDRTALFPSGWREGMEADDGMHGGGSVRSGETRSGDSPAMHTVGDSGGAGVAGNVGRTGRMGPEALED